MQSRLLNSSIESTLTLVVSGLCVALITVGTFSMARPADTVVTVVTLEPVVITGKRAAAKLAETGTPAVAGQAQL